MPYGPLLLPTNVAMPNLLINIRNMHVVRSAVAYCTRVRCTPTVYSTVSLLMPCCLYLLVIIWLPGKLELISRKLVMPKVVDGRLAAGGGRQELGN